MSVNQLLTDTPLIEKGATATSYFETWAFTVYRAITPLIVETSAGDIKTKANVPRQIYICLSSSDQAIVFATPSEPVEVYVKRGGAGAVDITTEGGELIEFSTAASLASQYDAHHYIWTGTAWYQL